MRGLRIFGLAVLLSRIGLPQATTAATVFWLPGGAIVDQSRAAQAVALAGSGQVPPLVTGPFTDARLYGLTYQRLSVTDAPSLAFGGDLNVDAWFYPQASSPGDPAIYRWDDGGYSNQFAITVTANVANFEIANAVGTEESLIVNWPISIFQRWTHFRFVAQLTGGVEVMAVYMDGQLIARKVTALTEIASTNLGPIFIGNNGGNPGYNGRIACVQIQNTAQTSGQSCSPSIHTRRVTGRQFRIVEADLAEERNDVYGSGTYIADLSDFTLGDTVVDYSDIVGVTAIVDGERIEFTELGNEVDMDAATDWSYWVDIPNRTIRLGGGAWAPDDTGHVKQLKLVIRQKWADKGVTLGGRFYEPIVSSVGAGERAASLWNEPLKLGQGGVLNLAAAGLPENIANLAESRVSWPNAPVSIFMGSDQMPRCVWTPELWGIIDSQPDDSNGDVLTARLYSEMARLFRVPADQDRFDMTTYPHMDPAHDGYKPPVPIGAGLQKVPLICLDTVGREITYTDGLGQTIRGRFYLYGWAKNTPCARINSWGDSQPGNDLPGVINVDLEACTLESDYGNIPLTASVNIDGFGAPSVPQRLPLDTYPPAQTYPGYGDTNDCFVLPQDVLEQLLALKLRWSIGASFADTGSRVQRSVRGYDWPGLSDIVFAVCRATLTHVWTKPSTQTVEWTDVNKSRPTAGVIRAADVVRRRSIDYAPDLARKVVGAALSYPVAPPGWAGPAQSSTASLDLDTDEIFEAKAVTDLGQLGVYNLATAAQVLDAARSLGLETPIKTEELFLTQRFAGIEQFDVYDLQLPGLPEGDENRYIVFSVHPTDGGVKLLLAPESAWAAEDGTSATYARSPRSPQIHASYSDAPSGTAVSTTGSWQFIGEKLCLFQGAFTTFHAALTHRLQGYASRTGGAAGDMQIRLVEVDPTDMTTIVKPIAAWSSVTPTSLGFLSALTALSDAPSTEDTILRWQYQLAVGASGHIAFLEWLTAETSSAGALSFPPASTLWADGYATGADCVAGSFLPVPHFKLGFANFSNQWPVGASARWAIYADPAGATGFHVYIYSVVGPAFSSTSMNYGQRLADFGPIDSEGFYSFEIRPQLAFMAQPFIVLATVESGTAKLYAAAVAIQNRPGV